jgi:Asp/Glu/hydantoin racemase
LAWAGLIRVITTDDGRTLNLHGRQIEAAFPGLRVVSRCLQDHPEGVHDTATEATAAPLVVRLAGEFQDEGASTVLVSCAADPGVAEASRQLRIPVIGAGAATALIAAGLSGKVGVVGISDVVPEAMAAVLGRRLLAYSRPEGVSTTLDLLDPAIKEAVVSAARAVARAGAGVIALACTGYATIGIASLIREATGLHVVDPVMALGLFGYYTAVLEARRP